MEKVGTCKGLCIMVRVPIYLYQCELNGVVVLNFEPALFNIFVSCRSIFLFSSDSEFLYRRNILNLVIFLPLSFSISKNFGERHAFNSTLELLTLLEPGSEE